MNSMKLSLLIPVFAVFAASTLQSIDAAETIESVRQRFEGQNVEEIPDFQKHVVPMMGRLGCNGRACHGSFQGQGGFRLSLFGYDFKMDHEGMGERIDLDKPSESYALQKATLTETHEGGKRMDEGSWEYNIFLNWIKGGAKPVESPIELVELVVTPKEVVFSGKGQTEPLKVIAVWKDGTQEDVTVMCRYTTNDDMICSINEDGVVSSGEVGDSHVVVAYDKAVVPVPVLRPVSDQTGDRYPQIAGRTDIDQHVIAKLRKMGIVPSDVCDDTEFLRRVSLDMTGTLPTPSQVRAFLADSSPNKREQKIDELLETPAYAAWWTVQLSDWTGCSDASLNNVNPASRQRGSQDWYDWIYKRVNENVAYDEIVENIVVAKSRQPGENYREYSERMSHYAADKDASFADQEGLIYFWGRNTFRQTEDRAIGFAYTFMATRIQCAQCHKHPFDVWTQTDFQEFEQFFARVNFARNGSDRAEYNKMIKELGLEGLRGNDQRRAVEKALNEGKTIPFPELVINKPRISPAARKKQQAAKAKGRNVAMPGKSAKLLGEQVVDVDNVDDPRTALMDWLRQSPTQLFAKAFVNRVWANYFNKGIVEPTDDLSLGNPPSNEALLNYLAQGFIDSGYDMKWVHKQICLSDTYQRSWKPNETNIQDERNFSRSVPRRLPAEVAFDALTMATTNDARAKTFSSDLKGRALTRTSPPRNANSGADYALAVFGRSSRESNCDCDRSSEASLLQTLFVRNDRETLEMLDGRGSWVAQLTGRKPNTNNASNNRQDNRRQAGEQQFKNLMRQLVKAKKAKETERIALLEKRIANVERQLDKLPKDEPEAKKSADFVADQAVEEAYLRTVSRFPTEQEREIALSYVTGSEDPGAGLKDLMWALINTKEFMVNH